MKAIPDTEVKRMFRRFQNTMSRFLYGRNGTDKLNLFLMFTALFLEILVQILSSFFTSGVMRWIYVFLNSLAMALFIACLFRTFSRNLYQRRRENMRFLQFFRQLKDRNNRYYRCPRCRQTVRVPRGRGKICIKCPKCGEKFIKKS